MFSIPKHIPAWRCSTPPRQQQLGAVPLLTKSLGSTKLSSYLWLTSVRLSPRGALNLTPSVPRIEARPETASTGQALRSVHPHGESEQGGQRSPTPGSLCRDLSAQPGPARLLPALPVTWELQRCQIDAFKVMSHSFQKLSNWYKREKKKKEI